MRTAAQTTFPERVGRSLGRLWRGCVRLDRRAKYGLVAKGWAPGMAGAVLLVADGSYEILWTRGRMLAGVHDATTLEAALALAQELDAGLVKTLPQETP